MNDEGEDREYLQKLQESSALGKSSGKPLILTREASSKNLIEHIDRFRNSLLYDQEAGPKKSGKMTPSKQKGHVKNHKSLDPQELKWQQQKMIAMKLRATNDVKVERQRRATMASNSNTSSPYAKSLSPVPADIQKRNFEQFNRRMTAKQPLSPTALDKIVEDNDEMNQSYYMLTEQSQDKGSKNSKMQIVS